MKTILSNRRTALAILLLVSAILLITPPPTISEDSKRSVDSGSKSAEIAAKEAEVARLKRDLERTEQLDIELNHLRIKAEIQRTKNALITNMIQGIGPTQCRDPRDRYPYCR